MAKRVETYRLNRKIHLYLSLVLIIFSGFFIFSGWMMIETNWFKSEEPVPVVKTLPFHMEIEGDSIQIAKKIQAEFKLYGRIDDPVRLYDGRWQFSYYRPGVTETVTLNQSLDSVQITTSDYKTTERVINRLHHLQGYNGSLRNIIWAIFVDLSAIAMVLFPITGIIMWNRTRKQFKYGLIFLVSGFSIIFALIIIQYLIP